MRAETSGVSVGEMYEDSSLSLTSNARRRLPDVDGPGPASPRSGEGTAGIELDKDRFVDFPARRWRRDELGRGEVDDVEGIGRPGEGGECLGAEADADADAEAEAEALFRAASNNAPTP